VTAVISWQWAVPLVWIIYKIRFIIKTRWKQFFCAMSEFAIIYVWSCRELLKMTSRDTLLMAPFYLDYVFVVEVKPKAGIRWHSIEIVEWPQVIVGFPWGQKRHNIAVLEYLHGDDNIDVRISWMFLESRLLFSYCGLQMIDTISSIHRSRGQWPLTHAFTFSKSFGNGFYFDLNSELVYYYICMQSRG